MSILLNKMFQKNRLDFDKLTQDLHGSLPFPDDVMEVRDIFYSNDKLPSHTLDIYRPAHTAHTSCDHQRSWRWFGNGQ